MGAKRPLKWAMGLTEEDPATVRGKTYSLLQEGPAVLEEIVHHGKEGLNLLLNKDAAKDVDMSILTLGSRLFHQARAVNLLLQNGYIGPSILLVREMVHTLALALFLQSHPEKAVSWLRAETKEERLRFQFGRIWKHVELGEAWKELYDYYSTMAHGNSEAKVTYARSRHLFGFDLQLQGFYDPVPIATFLVETMRFCLWFQQYFFDWYSEDLDIPVQFGSRLELLDEATKEYYDRVKERADREATTADYADSLSIYEQSRAIFALRQMIEEKRRGDAST